MSFRLLVTGAILLVLLVPATLRPQSGQSSSAERLLQQGLEAYRDHRLTEALSRVREAYQMAPADAKVRLTLGLMLYESDPASPEAQQIMESIVPEFPDNSELQLKLLDSYLQLKNESKLPSFLRMLRTSTAVNNRFAFDVVYTLVRYGLIDLAKAQLKEISKRLQPKLDALVEQKIALATNQALMHDAGEICFMRGMFAASIGDKNEAMREFKSADSYDFPARDSVQMNMLAEALFRLDEYPLSIQAYETYLKSFPGDSLARMHLAQSCYAAALFPRARENFQKVLERAPQTENVHLYLGLTLLEQKNAAEARQQFHEELKVAPQSYQAMAELAYLDYLEGDNEHCRQWLGKARILNPDWTETNMVFGLLYNRLGQFDLAIQSLTNVVNQNPDYYKAHFQLSLAYRRIGNETKAKEHADIYERLIAAEKARQLGDNGPK
jgi:tetratricopeptide (TPR) repeat protein